MNLNLVHELKFKCAKLDKFWQIKIESGSKSKIGKVKVVTLL